MQTATGFAADSDDPRVRDFERHRGLLFSLAYRMVGSVADAEDLVQDACIRWIESGATVRSPRAYLCRTVTRLALDHLRSARVRREEYVGPWLPEPLIESADAAPVDPVELTETLSTAFLRILERLAPLERAVFLLREVFGFEHAEVARIVERDVVACRQIAKRARDRVSAERPRFEASAEEAARVAELFLGACATGDVNALLPLLAADVVSWTDSGGRVSAARRPVVGAERCARMWAGLGRKGFASARLERVRVNGQPGVIIRLPGQHSRVLALSVSAGRVREIFVFSNPDSIEPILERLSRRRGDRAPARGGDGTLRSDR